MTTINNPVLESAEFIVNNASDVWVEQRGVDSAAEWLAALHSQGAFSLKRWRQENPLHFQEMSDDCVQWVFLVDCLNFSFWSSHPDGLLFAVDFAGALHTGYWSLPAALNRALAEGVPLLSAEYLRDLTLAQLARVFRSATAAEVPLLEERLAVLRETGAVLCDRFGGLFSNVLLAAGGSALRLVELVAQHFPHFADAALFQGRRVLIAKRAQILAADLWAAFEGQGWGAFGDIDQITMFADYRVPQVLQHLGMLRYSDGLLETLRRGEMLPPGSSLEVQIRGASIWAVELLRRRLVEIMRPGDVKDGGKDEDQITTTETISTSTSTSTSTTSIYSSNSIINAITIDFYLWDYAKLHAEEMKDIPIHRTRSIYY